MPVFNNPPKGPVPLNSITAATGLNTTRLQLATGSGASLNVNGIPSATTSWLYMSGFAFGSTTNANAALNYIGISDSAQAGGIDGFRVAHSVGTGSFHGNRNAIHTSIQVNAVQRADGGTQAQCGSFTEAYTAGGQTVYGTGYGGLGTPGAYSVQIFGTNQNARVQNASYIGGVWADEGDILTDSGSIGLASRVGKQVTALPGSVVQGAFADQAFAIVNQQPATVGWRYGYGTGAETSSWPIDGTWGTVRGCVQRIISGIETQGALYGTDDRCLTIASGGASAAWKNAAIGATGTGHFAAITTPGSLQSESCSLTGITLIPAGDGITGGLYTSIPNITVAAPANGVTALVTVATLLLGRIVGFGSTGSGYTVNDILIINGGTSTVAASIKVTSVDVNGGIITASVNAGGTYTSYPANVNYPTGGTGTGGGFCFTWSNSSLTLATPQVSGKNYVVGDTISTGGTGTQGVLTVDTVDSFGGIITAHPTTPGSLTVLPSNPAFLTGGSGTGVNLLLGFSIATTTIGTPGSGYTKCPPIITSTQSLYRTAKFNAVLTATSTDLSLNPNGGTVILGQAYTVTTLPAATSALKGARAYVTDATAPTFLGTLTGGSTVICPVFCNGTAWVAG